MTIRFLIVGTQRTGSQALFLALNLHPEVVCGGEWTQDVAGYRKLSVAKRALYGDISDVRKHRPADEMRRADQLGASAGWYGFKILFRSSDKWLVRPRLSPALVVDRLEAHLAWLQGTPDIRIIQLVRRDGVEWLKSKYLARTTGSFTHTHYPDDAKVTVPVAKAIKALESKNWVDRRLSTLASSNPYLRVVYEDFAADNRRGLETCLEFLGCDSNRIPRDARFTEKQSKQSAANYIRNYDELSRALECRGLRSSALLAGAMA